MIGAAKAGATPGAAIGTAVAPGVGNVVGAAIGGAAGAVTGILATGRVNNFTKGSIVYYVVASFLGTALGFMTWKAIRLWTRPEVVDDFSTAFAFLPFGKDVRRGEVRSVLLTVITLWSAAVLFVGGLMPTEEETSGLNASDYIAAGAVVVILLCILCEVAVILFNRPKFVVPPHMRGDLGVIAARRARRKR